MNMKFKEISKITKKMLKKIDNALHANDYKHFYNEDFDKVIFIGNQDIFLQQVLIKLILIMIIILMKMIWILLFISDFWLDALNLKNAKHLRKR